MYQLTVWDRPTCPMRDTFYLEYLTRLKAQMDRAGRQCEIRHHEKTGKIALFKEGEDPHQAYKYAEHCQDMNRSTRHYERA